MLKRVMLVITLVAAATVQAQDVSTSTASTTVVVNQPVVAIQSTIGAVNTGTSTTSVNASTTISAEVVVDVATSSNLIVSTSSVSSATGTSDALVVSSTTDVQQEQQEPAQSPEDPNFLNLALDGFEIVLGKLFGWDK